MSTEKIQQLVDKIDKAILTINHLKDENENYNGRIRLLEQKIEVLSMENQKLKSENDSKSREIDQVDRLHETLELKIEEILNCIPEDAAGVSFDDDNDEERIKKFVGKNKRTAVKPKQEKEKKESKPVNDQDDGTTLFEDGTEEEIDDFTKTDIEESNDDISVSRGKGVDLNYERSLLGDDDRDDVDFYFDSDDNAAGSKSDLPKGIL